MKYTKQDIYNFTQNNPIINQHEETKRYFFADSVLFAKPDTLEREVYELLSDVCRDIDSGTFDLNYEILASALQYFDNEALEYDDLMNDNFEINFPFEGFASIYTFDRLSYLNINNQHDIAQAIHEGASEDIDGACAYWYDHQVEQTIYALIQAFKA